MNENVYEMSDIGHKNVCLLEKNENEKWKVLKKKHSIIELTTRKIVCLYPTHWHVDIGKMQKKARFFAFL